MIGDGKKQEPTELIEPDRRSDGVAVNTDDKQTQMPKGMIVAQPTVIDGPGCGKSFALFAGDNAIGRGHENRVNLDLGDKSIHRRAHAWIAARDGSFVIEHSGQRNPVFVNGERLAGKRGIALGDRIRLGSTTLRLDAKQETSCTGA